jgi:hypothetical protein
MFDCAHSRYNAEQEGYHWNKESSLNASFREENGQGYQVQNEEHACSIDELELLNTELPSSNDDIPYDRVSRNKAKSDASAKDMSIMHGSNQPLSQVRTVR